MTNVISGIVLRLSRRSQRVSLDILDAVAWPVEDGVEPVCGIVWQICGGKR